MGANLIQMLKQVPDFRSKGGQRHPLWLILLLVIMGTMSGYLSYRALGKFVQRYHDVLIEQLELSKPRLPSYSTFRRVMMKIDFDILAALFNNWAKNYNYVSLDEKEYMVTEGKLIKSTVNDYDIAYQNFVMLVLGFSLQQGLLVQLEKLQHKQDNQVATMQVLINALNLETKKGSLIDSLHR